MNECYWCGKDILMKRTENHFPPCEVCGKKFSLKIFPSCSRSCSLNIYNSFKEENIFCCHSCNVKVCLCDCKWLHFNDKKSCKCKSCVNNYNETLCEKCNQSEKN